MKTVKIQTQTLIILFLMPFLSFAQNAYMVEEADTYFKAGRYFDAFFRYRDCVRLPEYQSDNARITLQVKNSSHALYLTQKFKDYRALSKFQLAKDHLNELVVLNPDDPYRGEIPRLTLAQASELQRMAWRQPTRKATAEMLNRAIKYYHQAIVEGLMDENLQMAIRQCEASINDAQKGEPIDKTTIVTSTQPQPATTPQVQVLQPQTLPATIRKPTVEILPQKKENN